MKPILYLLLVLATGFASCTGSNSNSTKDDSTPIITIDSSEFNGRLFVYTKNFSNGAALGSSDVYLYVRYEDILNRIPLNYVRSSANDGEADFGYLLQGNYYIVSSKSLKSDTSLVQVLSKRTIKRDVFLK